MKSRYCSGRRSMSFLVLVFVAVYQANYWSTEAHDFLCPKTKASKNLESRIPSLVAPTSLAERLQEIAPQETDFLERLQAEETAMKLVTKTHPSPFFLWQSLAASLFLVGLSQYWLGGGNGIPLWKDLRQAGTTAVAVNGWSIFEWLNGSHNSSWSHRMGVLAVTFGQPEAFLFLWNTIFPKIAQTLRKMVFAELWNRFFVKVFRSGAALMVTTTPGTPLLAWDLPPWLQMIQGFVVTAVRKGTKKMFQTALQKHLHKSIVGAVNYLLTVIREQVQVLR